MIRSFTYYFWILFINACNTALTSAVLCGWNIGRKAAANRGANRCDKSPECGSGGPTIVRTSGKTVSSVENVLVTWSSNDFRGSTLVGDKHDSNTDFGSADKLSDCFFLPTLLGVLLDARNNLFRRSINVGGSFSRGGLPVFWGSEWASGSVFPVRSSLPELSFFQSLALSEIWTNKSQLYYCYTNCVLMTK